MFLAGAAAVAAVGGAAAYLLSRPPAPEPEPPKPKKRTKQENKWYADFKKIDKDGSGKASKGELVKYMVKTYGMEGFAVKEAEKALAFDGGKGDDDDELDFEEYCAMMRDRMKIATPRDDDDDDDDDEEKKQPKSPPKSGSPKSKGKGKGKTSPKKR